MFNIREILNCLKLNVNYKAGMSYSRQVGHFSSAFIKMPYHEGSFKVTSAMCCVTGFFLNQNICLGAQKNRLIENIYCWYSKEPSQ